MRAPDEFEASIGNGLDGYYHVTLVGPRLFWRFRDGVAEELTPTPQDWGRFRRALDDVDVWRWSGKYIDETILDGDYWGVRVSWDGRSVESSGANAFPLRFGEVLAAVSDLVGGRTFA